MSFLSISDTLQTEEHTPNCSVVTSTSPVDGEETNSGELSNETEDNEVSPEELSSEMENETAQSLHQSVDAKSLEIGESINAETMSTENYTDNHTSSFVHSKVNIKSGIVNNKSTSNVNLAYPCDEFSSSSIGVNPVHSNDTNVLSNETDVLSNDMGNISELCTDTLTLCRTDNSSLDMPPSLNLGGIVKGGDIKSEEIVSRVDEKEFTVNESREERIRELNGVCITETDTKVYSALDTVTSKDNEVSDTCEKSSDNDESKKVFCKEMSNHLSAGKESVENNDHTNGDSNGEKFDKKSVENELNIEENNFETTPGHASLDAPVQMESDQNNSPITHNDYVNSHVEITHNTIATESTDKSSLSQVGDSNEFIPISDNTKDASILNNYVDKSSHHGIHCGDGTDKEDNAIEPIESTRTLCLNSDNETKTENLINNPKLDTLTDDTFAASVEDKCDKLVDYPGSGSDSEVDSLESEDESSLHIVDTGMNKENDGIRKGNDEINKVNDKNTETIGGSEKIDHSERLEKGSINTYSEKNSPTSKKVEHVENQTSIENKTAEEVSRQKEVINNVITSPLEKHKSLSSNVKESLDLQVKSTVNERIRHSEKSEETVSNKCVNDDQIRKRWLSNREEKQLTQSSLMHKYNESLGDVKIKNNECSIATVVSSSDSDKNISHKIASVEAGKFISIQNKRTIINLVKTIESVINKIVTCTGELYDTKDLLDFLNDVEDLVCDPETYCTDVLWRVQQLIRGKEYLTEFVSNDETQESDEEVIDKLKDLVLKNEDVRTVLVARRKVMNIMEPKISGTRQLNDESVMCDESLMCDEDLEMGVFEESDTESVGNEVNDKPNDKPTPVSYVYDESSTDTADSDGNMEEFNIQQSTQMSSRPLKRKQYMNSIKKVPPAKKLAMSRGPMTRCKFCKLPFVSDKHASEHKYNCKFVPQAGPLLSKSNVVNPSSSKLLLNIAPKSNSNSVIISNSRILTKHDRTSPSELFNIASTLTENSSIWSKSTKNLDINIAESAKNVDNSKAVTRKVFLCASCHIYFEFWNLYLHMLEKHKRYICLYCLGMFGHSNNLYHHLRTHHNISINNIANVNSNYYKSFSTDNFILTCMSCGTLVENNDMERHTCFTKPQSLNSSLNSSMESYIDPESLMLATMTEGEHDSDKTKTVEVVNLEESPIKEVIEVQVKNVSPVKEVTPVTLEDNPINEASSAAKESEPKVTTPCAFVVPTSPNSTTNNPQKLSFGNDRLTETINEVAENRAQPIISPNESTATTTPATPPKPPSPVASSSPFQLPSSAPSSSSFPPPSPRFEDSASAALSELEKCHKLLIEERSSDDDTESDMEESLVSKSLVNCIGLTPENFSENILEQAKTFEDNLPEKISSTEDKSELQTPGTDWEKLKRDIFDPKVVLDKLELPVDGSPTKSSEDETSAVPNKESDKTKDNYVNSPSSLSSAYNVISSPSSSRQTKEIDSVSDKSPKLSEDQRKDKSITETANVSLEKEFSTLSDDDNNQDFNDSDNENSLKIDDSVFEDDEVADEPSEVKDVPGHSKSLDIVAEEKTEVPAFKINPLRIKIKCGNSGDNQYERVKTATEIREREARERRYDEAIDEAIRKAIMEYERRQAEREQIEKEKEEKRKEKELREKEKELREKEREQKEIDEYERLQAELTKKQEEYQRIQEAYMNLHTRQDKQDDDKENESTEHDESLEEASESRNEMMESEYEIDKAGAVRRDSSEKESDERVKLIERNQDEKSSLLKEELLKKCENLFAGFDQPEEEQESEPPPVILASEDIQPMALLLDDRLDNLDIRVVIKECVRTSCTVCVYCYHATRIVVNGKQLALHILAEHRYKPVKNDTSEDLIQFIKSNLRNLENECFSSDTFDPTDKKCFVPFDNIYHCLQCGFSSKHQRELTSHKRKMHSKTSQICLLCKQILLNQSELLFHYCAGVENTNPVDNIYWCGVCGQDKIPSAFRLMVHLRKKHNTCNVCLEHCANEGKLLQHMLKHKIIHMCYKCNISYRNKQDITKHLFWKHGTESIVCKKCLQKRWSHVYHFCQPPARFTCDECNLSFKSSNTLKVHKRLHAGIFPYECTEENCEQKFISRKLLEKHIQWHREPPKPPSPPPQDKSDANTSEPHIDVCNVDETESPGAELKVGSKSKKKKKSKFDLNSLNLAPLNLSSESDSSDDDDSSKAHSVSGEESKADLSTNTESKEEEKSKLDDDLPVPPDIKQSSEKPSEPSIGKGLEASDKASETPTETPPTSTINMPDLTSDSVIQSRVSELPILEAPTEEPPPVPQDIVPDVWDQFTSFTNSLNVYRHVDYEHDYHVVYPREVEKPVEEAKTEGLEQSVPEVTGEKNHQMESEAPEKTVDTTLNKSTSDDSSSDSSSSSSCGSQCGSNCSCSSSSSSSSSSSDDSSSDSDSSDPESRRRQEEKRLAKKQRKRMKKHSHASEVNVTIENNAGERSPQAEGEVQVHSVTAENDPPTAPPIAESDLETEVSSSDEEFYDEKPQLSAPAKMEEKPSSQPTLSPHNTESSSTPRSPSQYLSPAVSHIYPSSAVSQSHRYSASPAPHYSAAQGFPPVTLTVSTPRTPSHTPKKRKRPRMRNVPTSTPKHTSSFKTSFNHPFMKPSPAFEKKKTPVPLIASMQTPPASFLVDDNTRSSKRKRKQNRFYGYSDDEDPGEFDNDESDEFSIMKQPPLKKKLLWKPAFDDKIPLPPASPPPYESKIRIENPFKVKSTPEYSYAGSTTPGYGTSEPEQHEDSSSDEDPTIAAYNKLSAMPPPPIVPEPGSVPLYCYCRCPYDEVSEMIACDGDDCEIEWYHFECVNILVPPKGKWYCPQCRPKYPPY